MLRKTENVKKMREKCYISDYSKVRKWERFRIFFIFCFSVFLNFYLMGAAVRQEWCLSQTADCAAAKEGRAMGSEGDLRPRMVPRRSASAQVTDAAVFLSFLALPHHAGPPSPSPYRWRRVEIDGSLSGGAAPTASWEAAERRHAGAHPREARASSTPLPVGFSVSAPTTCRHHQLSLHLRQSLTCELLRRPSTRNTGVARGW